MYAVYTVRSMYMEEHGTLKMYLLRLYSCVYLNCDTNVYNIEMGKENRGGLLPRI